MLDTVRMLDSVRRMVTYLQGFNDLKYRYGGEVCKVSRRVDVLLTFGVQNM